MLDLSSAWNRLLNKPPASELRQWDYFIDPVRHFVSVRFTGRLTLLDIAHYVAALEKDPAFDPEFDEIIDLVQVQEIALDAQAVVKLADDIDPFSPASKRAFVAESSAQIHSARIHSLLRSDRANIRIFSSIEQADEWLASGSRCSGNEAN